MDLMVWRDNPPIKESNMSIKRITLDAVLTAVALSVFIIELQIPPLVPIPGVKLGLANIITVYAIFALGPKDAACILFARILLGGMFSGQIMSILYSLAGGCLCFAAMCIMRKIVTDRQIWVCSVIGAIAHNIGQIIVAIIISNTFALIVYLPVLLISGIIAGFCTGLCAQMVVKHMKNIHS